MEAKHSGEPQLRHELALGDVVLRYDDHGHGEPVLLLVHGFTGAALDFDAVIPKLATDRRVLAYDHRGHGDSTNTSDLRSYTFAHLTSDLAAFVDELDLAPTDLLGHSMGGIVSLQYALAHPTRVRSLVLMDTGAAPVGSLSGVFDGLVPIAREQGMSTAFEIVRTFWQQQSEASGAPVDPTLLERVRQKFCTMDPEAFAAFAEELGTYPSMVERLGEITCPVTVIVGENDTGLRASADTLASGIAGSELVVIPDAGHSPQEDQPEAWTAAVLGHLGRL
jgi:pimeloyl-ACP methyl ester carboxylesterase